MHVLLNKPVYEVKSLLKFQKAFSYESERWEWLFRGTDTLEIRDHELRRAA